MTEAEWLACADPAPMLEFLRGKASDRKLRLFACGCFYPVRNFFSKVTQKAVEVAERFADGKGSPEELNQAFRLARGARKDWRYVQRFRLSQSPWDMAGWWADDAARTLANDALNQAGRTLRTRTAVGLEAKQKERRKGAQARKIYEDAWWPERKAQADLLRELFGNPFRPSPPLPLAILAWNDRTIPRIAEAIYEERQMPAGTLDTARLGILADALLDAGCEDDELICHCRSEGPHVRGCWAVDLILGKE